MVQQRDFDHHTNGEGRLNHFEIHATLESANASAKELMAEEAGAAPDSEEPEESYANGMYSGYCHLFEDERDHITIEVTKENFRGASRLHHPIPPQPLHLLEPYRETCRWRSTWSSAATLSVPILTVTMKAA
jgi:hypothetical protein